METVTCCDCGYEWEKGRSGAHSCSSQLNIRVAKLETKNEMLTAALNRQREGLVNLIDLNIIHQNYVESARTEIARIDEVLKQNN